MRPISFANAGCILCIIVVLGCQATVGKLEDDETSQPLRLGFAQDLEQAASNQYPLEPIKRAMMRNMLEQHALRLKRGGFNSGFAHALRVRRGGIGQRSSWGHALRVRSSNMLNRGHALRIKRKPSDYRAFALRVKKDDDDEDLNNLLDEASEGQDLPEEAINPGFEDLNNNYSDLENEHKGYADPEVNEAVRNYRQKRMRYQIGTGNDASNMYQGYYGNQYLNSWPLPARRLRSASFAHVLRV